MGLRLSLVLSVILLQACVSSPRTTPPQLPTDVDAPPSSAVSRAMLEALPNPTVRVEPRSRVGNHSPYVVFGKTYEVMSDARDYEQEGLASWYGRKFHGRSTSSGEPYDMLQLTAAHKSLPLPSYVRVTNLRNGRSTVVRVNDRGPFHGDRIIDLSYAAAVKLGYDLQGTAPVRVELLAQPSRAVAAASQPARPAMAANSAEPLGIRNGVNQGESSPRSLFLQAGAFASLDSARRLLRDIRDVIGDSVPVQAVHGDDDLRRVRIGPFNDLQQATAIQEQLVAARFAVPLLIWE